MSEAKHPLRGQFIEITGSFSGSGIPPNGIAVNVNHIVMIERTPRGAMLAFVGVERSFHAVEGYDEIIAMIEGATS